MVSTEQILAANPFTFGRRAKLGDSHPAGVVYAFEYVISTAGLFYLFSFNSMPQRARRIAREVRRAISIPQTFRISLERYPTNVSRAARTAAGTCAATSLQPQ
jgi:hypothetical protein